MRKKKIREPTTVVVVVVVVTVVVVVVVRFVVAGTVRYGYVTGRSGTVRYVP